MKCDGLKEVMNVMQVSGDRIPSGYYKKHDVDAAIAELKADINNVLIQNRELCQALHAMYSAEEYTNLQDENTQLKQKLDEKESWVKMLGEGESALSLELERTKRKLESVQARMYADVVDANMEVRRLKRALYKACANWAHATIYYSGVHESDEFKWENMETECLKKAEEYK